MSAVAFAPGIFRVWPAMMWFASVRPLAFTRRVTVVPYRPAMEERFSPTAMVWLPALRAPPPPVPGGGGGVAATRRSDPAQTRFTSVMPLALARACTGRPYRLAIAASDSPGRTTWVVASPSPDEEGADGAGAAAPPACPGMVRTCPTMMRLGLWIELTSTSESTDTPLRAAMALRVSPDRTV